MSEFDLNNARRVIKLALIKIGIRCDLLGFSYLCYAAELVIEKPNRIHKLCSCLYKEIAEKFSSSENCVERGIRHVIEITYLNKGFMELNRMFNIPLYTLDSKPTAGELIRLVSEYFVLGLYKQDLPCAV